MNGSITVFRSIIVGCLALLLAMPASANKAGRVSFAIGEVTAVNAAGKSRKLILFLLLPLLITTIPKISNLRFVMKKLSLEFGQSQALQEWNIVSEALSVVTIQGISLTIQPTTRK